MKEDDVMYFHTISELQSSVENDLQMLKKKSVEYSEAIGEKLRSGNTASDTVEMAKLKEKLEGPADPKKKKPVKKKDQKANWYDLGNISVYDGIGPKGELEIYFKALEELKSKIERLEKIKTAIDDLISKGVKRELGCMALLNHDLTLQISFIAARPPKAKFSYKSIFNVPGELVHEIKI
jgi:hypothetical protein